MTEWCWVEQDKNSKKKYWCQGWNFSFHFKLLCGTTRYNTTNKPWHNEHVKSFMVSMNKKLRWWQVHISNQLHPLFIHGVKPTLANICSDVFLLSLNISRSGSITTVNSPRSRLSEDECSGTEKSSLEPSMVSNLLNILWHLTFKESDAN